MLINQAQFKDVEEEEDERSWSMRSTIKDNNEILSTYDGNDNPLDGEQKVERLSEGLQMLGGNRS